MLRFFRRRRQSVPDTLRAWQVFAVVVLALLAAVLLNAPHLLHRAEQKPFGHDRDFWVAVWTPFDAASRSLRLDRPRRWLDHALDRDDAASRPTFRLPDVNVRSFRPSPAVTPETVPTPSPFVPTATDSAAVDVFLALAGAPTDPPVSTVPWPPLRTPTPERPLRLWVGGDSLSVRFGESLARAAGASGLMTAALDSRIATGLARPDVFDWPAETAAVASADAPPDVMVVLFGANDLQPLRTDAGDIVAPRTDAWRDEYARRVAGLIALMRASGRFVVWVGLPPARDAARTAQLREIDAIIRAQTDGVTGVFYVDAWHLFADVNGEYTAYLDDGDGNVQQVREPDGLHFTRAGGDRLAAAIMRAVRIQAGLRAD